MLVASVVAAVDIEAPETAESGGMTTIRWTPDSSLDTFSIELTHPSFVRFFYILFSDYSSESQNNAIAIANNVNPDTGMIDVSLPSVPSE